MVGIPAVETPIRLPKDPIPFGRFSGGGGAIECSEGFALHGEFGVRAVARPSLAG